MSRLLANNPDEETIMAPTSRSLPMPAPFARSFAVAALMGATMLASPWTAARADTIGNAATQLAQAAAPSNAPSATPATEPQGSSQGSMSSTQDKAEAAAGATQGKSETVDERITSLHAALKITPAEEAKWNAVAQAMRENAAAIDKVATEAQAKPPQTTTAMEDLRLYQRFAEAHANGLKNLISSFNSLYNAMPEAQKKNADSVFAASREARQQASGAHS
jgi:periplasmic protein CpxP/Spy